VNHPAIPVRIIVEKGIKGKKKEPKVFIIKKGVKKTKENKRLWNESGVLALKVCDP